MKIQPTDLSAPIARSLYALNLTPNQMTFWALLIAAKAILEDPLRLTAIRCQLFPEIESRLGVAPAGVDSLFRRASSRMMTDKDWAPLRAYLPKDTKMSPTVSVFLSMWVRYIADRMSEDELMQISEAAQPPEPKKSDKPKQTI